MRDAYTYIPLCVDKTTPKTLKILPKMGAPLGTFCIFRDVYRDTCRAGNIGMCVGI